MNILWRWGRCDTNRWIKLQRCSFKHMQALSSELHLFYFCFMRHGLTRHVCCISGPSDWCSMHQVAGCNTRCCSSSSSRGAVLPADCGRQQERRKMAAAAAAAATAVPFCIYSSLLLVCNKAYSCKVSWSCAAWHVEHGVSPQRVLCHWVKLPVVPQQTVCWQQPVFWWRHMSEARS